MSHRRSGDDEGGGDQRPQRSFDMIDHGSHLMHLIDAPDSMVGVVVGGEGGREQRGSDRDGGGVEAAAKASLTSKIKSSVMDDSFGALALDMDIAQSRKASATAEQTPAPAPGGSPPGGAKCEVTRLRRELRRRASMDMGRMPSAPTAPVDWASPMPPHMPPHIQTQIEQAYPQQPPPDEGADQPMSPQAEAEAFERAKTKRRQRRMRRRASLGDKPYVPPPPPQGQYGVADVPMDFPPPRTMGVPMGGAPMGSPMVAGGPPPPPPPPPPDYTNPSYTTPRWQDTAPGEAGEFVGGGNGDHSQPPRSVEVNRYAPDDEEEFDIPIPTVDVSSGGGKFQGSTGSGDWIVGSGADDASAGALSRSSGDAGMIIERAWADIEAEEANRRRGGVGGGIWDRLKSKLASTTPDDSGKYPDKNAQGGDGIWGRIRATFGRGGDDTGQGDGGGNQNDDGSEPSVDPLTSARNAARRTMRKANSSSNRGYRRKSKLGGNLAPRQNSRTSLDMNFEDLDVDYADDVYKYNQEEDGGGGQFIMVKTAFARCGKYFFCSARLGMCLLIVLSAVALAFVFVDLEKEAEKDITAASHLGGDGSNNNNLPQGAGTEDRHIGGGNNNTTEVANKNIEIGASFAAGAGVANGASDTDGGVPTDRLNSIRNLLLVSGISSHRDLDPGHKTPDGSTVKTPQRSALEWISNVDPANIERTDVGTLVPRYALATLFYATNSAAGNNGGGWDNSDGWLSGGTVCTWKGVTCDLGPLGNGEIRQGMLRAAMMEDSSQAENDDSIFPAGPPTVTGLNISSNGLEGTIPKEIMVALTELRVLDLSYNGIGGTFPSEISRLVHLVTLHIVGTEMAGTLPSALGSLINLNSLFLGSNLFTGAVPEELGNLQNNLHALALDENELVGSIPESIGELENLKILHLHGNALVGKIPDSLKNLEVLKDLRLSRNELSGPIPRGVISKLRKLEILHLDSNALTSSIPEEFNANETALEDVQMNNNQLDGMLPASLSSLPNLHTLRLDHNDLKGSIPPEWGEELKSVRRLDLSWNGLSGPIPAQLGRMISLEALGLDHNKLTGTLPPSLGGLKTMTYLAVENNLLVGTVSTSFGQLSNLETFNLFHNSFKGVMPEEVCALTAASLSKLTADCTTDDRYAAAFQCDCCHECY